MQIGHTVFNRDVFVVDIFESASLFEKKKRIYCSSVTVCFHKCTIISVTESAHDMTYNKYEINSDKFLTICNMAFM